LEGYVQLRLQKSHADYQFCQSNNWMSCGDGAIELMFCCGSCVEVREVRSSGGQKCVQDKNVFRSSEKFKNSTVVK
jgi:kynureninase